VKINAKCTLDVPSPHDGPLDQSKWEIMYPHFVKEGLIGPSDCVNKKNV
jgi:hypothetical protein